MALGHRLPTRLIFLAIIPFFTKIKARTLKCEEALDTDATWLVSFSGGKDSVAAWLHLERELGKRVQCIFADTGWEADETYKYLEELEEKHGMPLVRVYPRVRHLWNRDPPERIPEEIWDDRLDMQKLIELKGRAPSPMARFCTTILKLIPVREYVASHQSETQFMVSGVRAEESTKRSNMAPWAFDDFMGVWRWLPIQDWLVADVFSLHAKHGVPPNPLYKKGSSRVGCDPCMMANKDDLASRAKDEGFRKRLFQLEANTGRTFFVPNKVPPKYRSKVDPKSGKRLATAEDVLRWALEEQPQFAEDGLFGDQDVPLDYGEDIEAETCNSVYGLCE